MHKSIHFIASIFLTLISIDSYANFQTHRIQKLQNEKVNVWQTIIYPNKNQVLKMHQHQYDRVVIALGSGILKITNNRDKVHYLKLKKNQAYYLTKDITGESHRDENVGSYPIKVFVIELKCNRHTKNYYTHRP